MPIPAVDYPVTTQELVDFIGTYIDQQTGSTLRPTMYGGVGDDVADDTVAIQATFDAAKAAGYAAKRRVRVSLGGAKWKVTGQLTLDSHFVLIDGGGGVIDARTIANGTTLLSVTATGDQVEGQKSWNNSVESISALEIIGPGGTATYMATIGVLFAQPDTTKTIGPARLTLRNVVVHDFGSDVQYGSNTWGINHVDCAFYNANVAVYFPNGLTNSGERMTYRGCNIFSARILVNNSSTGCDMVFSQCSLDYPTLDASLAGFGVSGTSNPKRLIAYAAGGRIHFSQCHIEASHDDDYWFRVGVGSAGDPPSRISLSQCELVLASTKNNWEIGYVEPTDTPSGLSLSDCHFHMNSGYAYNLTSLIGGDGLARARGLSFEPNVIQWMPPVSRSLNRVDGTFEVAASLNDWSFLNDSPILATDQAKRGTQSLKFRTLANGNNSRAFVNIPVNPGDIALISFWNMIAGAQSSPAKFVVQLGWLKANGTTFVNPAVTWGGSATGSDHWDDTAGAWLQRKIPAMTAPPSAAFLQVYLQFNGQPTTSFAWVDDFLVNLIR